MEAFEYFYSREVPKKLKGDIKDSEGIDCLRINHLSKVNIFIGPNNSGKSLIVRELLKSDISSEDFDLNVITELNLKLKAIKEGIINEVFLKHSISSYGQGGPYTKKYFEELYQPISCNFLFREFVEKFKREKDKIVSQNNLSYTSNSDPSGNIKHIDIHKLQNYLLQSANLTETEIERLTFSILKLKRIYIPTIRTLRVFSNTPTNHPTQFKEKVSKEYQLDIKLEDSNLFLDPNIEIETGEDFYSNIYNLKNNDHDSESKLERFEEFLSEYFFEGQKIDFITNEKEKVVHVQIGKEKGQPIYNLGDGLQMLIIMTFPLFLYDGGFVCIEEPEIYLHPALQKKLIEILSTHQLTKNFIFYIATHSNHIMDCMNYAHNCSLFASAKIKPKEENTLPDFQLTNLEYGNCSILSSLGISSTSVYHSNCTIWVEGITDKLYLKKYIECFLAIEKNNNQYSRFKTLTEGIAYSFIFSGGDNIIFYDFDDDLSINDISDNSAVKFICGKSFVIVDDDNKKNIQRKKDLEKKLGFDFYILPVIEIENLLSPEVIVKTIKSFDSWSDLDENLFSAIKESDYKDQKLGSFIDQKLKQLYKNGKKKFAKKENSKNSDNLTLNCKRDFCNESIKHITYENMTQSSINVTRKIIEFILEHN